MPIICIDSLLILYSIVIVYSKTSCYTIIKEGKGGVEMKRNIKKAIFSKFEKLNKIPVVVEGERFELEDGNFFELIDGVQINFRGSKKVNAIQIRESKNGYNITFLGKEEISMEIGTKDLIPVFTSVTGIRL